MLGTRNIPITLQSSLDELGTTICYLLKMTARDGQSLAVTSLDVNCTYDDGAGALVYSAPIGVDQSPLDTSGDLDVDNSEATMLLATTGIFTPEQIEAGVLDYGRFVLYRVNYGDATRSQTGQGLTLVPQRHYIVQTGTIGVVKQVDGLAGVVELRGLTQKLKQNFIDLYSLTCRAKFGSGGGSAGCLQFGECGFNAETLWVSRSVTAVDAEEPSYTFTANSAPAVNGPNGALTFVPGVVEWLTGPNAGLQQETEVVAGAVITLSYATPSAIAIGHTFRIRPDCAKRFQEDCIDKYDNYLNFRGEPYIPLGDEGSQAVPNWSGTWSAQKIEPETEVP